MDSTHKIRRRFAIPVILFLFIIIIGIFLYSSKERKYAVEKTIEYIDEGEIIKVLYEDGRVSFQYSIKEFKDWAKENWDQVFKKPPSFGEIREVDVNNFYRFDSTASLSPDFSLLAFSVSDYAVATNISFVGLIELEGGKIELVGDKNIGSIQKLIWSPKGTHIAYILDTARAEGDYLSVDNIILMRKEFTLSEEDVLDIDTARDIHIFPNFNSLQWTENGRKIKFTVSSLGGGVVSWIKDIP